MSLYDPDSYFSLYSEIRKRIENHLFSINSGSYLCTYHIFRAWSATQVFVRVLMHMHALTHTHTQIDSLLHQEHSCSKGVSICQSNNTS